MKILTNKEYRRRIKNEVNKALEKEWRDEDQRRRDDRYYSRFNELEKRINILEEKGVN